MNEYKLKRRQYFQSLLLKILDDNKQPVTSLYIFQRYEVRYRNHKLSIYQIGGELSILKRMGLTDYILKGGARRYWFKVNKHE